MYPRFNFHGKHQIGHMQFATCRRHFESGWHSAILFLFAVQLCMKGMSQSHLISLLKEENFCSF